MGGETIKRCSSGCTQTFPSGILHTRVLEQTCLCCVNVKHWNYPQRCCDPACLRVPCLTVRMETADTTPASRRGTSRSFPPSRCSPYAWLRALLEEQQFREGRARAGAVCVALAVATLSAACPHPTPASASICSCGPSAWQADGSHLTHLLFFPARRQLRTGGWGRSLSPPTLS